MANDTASSSSAETSSNSSESPSLKEYGQYSDALAAERLVRFEDTCVLIPELQRRRARLITKSFSLPLWKKGALHFGGSAAGHSPDGEDSAEALNDVSEDEHVTLTVSLPSLQLGRLSKSPPRHAELPLHSCLVHRPPSLPSSPDPSSFFTMAPASVPIPISTPRRRPRSLSRTPPMIVSSPTLSPPISPNMRTHSSTPIETVPLRPCCRACIRNCTHLPPLPEGEDVDWTLGMKFTRGALRLWRSNSEGRDEGRDASRSPILRSAARYPAQLEPERGRSGLVHFKCHDHSINIVDLTTTPIPEERDTEETESETPTRPASVLVSVDEVDKKHNVASDIAGDATENLDEEPAVVNLQSGSLTGPASEPTGSNDVGTKQLPVNQNTDYHLFPLPRRKSSSSPKQVAASPSMIEDEDGLLAPSLSRGHELALPEDAPKIESGPSRQPKSTEPLPVPTPAVRETIQHTETDVSPSTDFIAGFEFDEVPSLSLTAPAGESTKDKYIPDPPKSVYPVSSSPTTPTRTRAHSHQPPQSQSPTVGRRRRPSLPFNPSSVLKAGVGALMGMNINGPMASPGISV